MKWREEMSVVNASREVEAPVSRVWATLADFGGIHRFNASVDRSPINEGTPPSGVGSERTCHLYDGNRIQERVVESVEEEKISIEIFETSMPLKSGLGVFTLVPTANGSTRVTVSMSYVVKYGPVGKLMDVLMVKRMLGSAMSRLLAGLDHYVTTGETIGNGWKPDEAARHAA